MPVTNKYGYYVSDDFERFYHLVMTCSNFIYTCKFHKGKFVPFDDKEHGQDKWKLKNWFKKSEVWFIDPKSCYDTERYRLTSLDGRWNSYYSIFSSKRFAMIKDFLLTGLCTLTDTGHIKAIDIWKKLDDAKDKDITYYGKSKRQSTLSSSLFGGIGREEEYGHTPFFDGDNGYANKAKGENCVFEKRSATGCNQRKRVPGQPGYISRRGSEVLSPFYGSRKGHFAEFN